MSQVQRVRVLRAFRHKGDDVGVGSVLNLDTPIAQEMRAGRKVEFVTADTDGKVLPLKKKDKTAPAPGASRVEQLADQVQGLTEQVSTLAGLIEKLTLAITPKAPAGK